MDHEPLKERRALAGNWTWTMWTPYCQIGLQLVPVLATEVGQVVLRHDDPLRFGPLLNSATLTAPFLLGTFTQPG